MERFGKFQLLERIGDGGMAEIFLARPADVSLSKLVAVKRILPQFLKEASYVDMFRREGEIALRLRHPSIVTVYELGTANKQPYMSMEFFPGKTLALLMQKLRKQNLALQFSDQFYIVKNIAEALQYMHEFSDYGDNTEIIHRDISPQNIMVGFDGAVKLIDFGVAKIVDSDESTRTAVLKGKMTYMSPEQIRGEKLTKQTDIFSLGIVLWELLAGRKLFPGKSIEDVARKIEICHVPMLSPLDSGIPPEVDLVCQRALAKDTRDRYRSAREFVADLDEVLRKCRQDGHQKRVAKALQSLFPEDMSKLQEQLKKFESEVQPSIPDSMPPVPVAPSPLTLTTPTPPQKSAQRPIQLRRSGETSPWVTNGLVFVLGGAAVLLATNLLKREPKEAPVVAVEQVTPVTRPVLNQRPVVQKPLQAPPPPPAPQVHPVVQAQPPVQPPMPKADPIVIKEPVRVEPKSVVVKATKPQKKSENRNSHIEDVRVRAKSAAAKSTPKPERKPAAVPALKSFAYLTIFADADAQIFVDGKPVGTEIVNDLKVPADKKVTVKVVNGSGKGAKTQILQLKPFSRNVVDLAAGAPD